MVNGSVDRRDPRPPYQQIVADLRRQLTSGELKVGEALPSTRGLATRYGVSLMTVHKAVDVLKREGVLEVLWGRGVFILSTDVDPGAEYVGRLLAEAEEILTDETDGRRLAQAQLLILRAQLDITRRMR